MKIYKCEDCKCQFEEPVIIYTTYESFYGISDMFLDSTKLELKVCPNCISENIEEEEIMQREIIYLNDATMSIDEIFELEDYVWENDKLIPIEMLNGE